MHYQIEFLPAALEQLRARCNDAVQVGTIRHDFQIIDHVAAAEAKIFAYGWPTFASSRKIKSPSSFFSPMVSG
jgi:hypothetical protein